jgi:hypothetical protein
MVGFDFSFLAICVLFGGLALFNAAYDNLLWLLIGFALFLVVTQFGFQYNMFAFVKANLGVIGLTFGVYLLLGIAWAFFKWQKLVKGKVAERNANADAFIKALAENRCPLPSEPDFMQAVGWESVVRQEVLRDLNAAARSDNAVICELARIYTRHFTVVKQPAIATYKDRFISWFLFWPFSAVVFLLNDFVRELCEYVYNSFARKLQSISDKLWNA